MFKQICINSVSVVSSALIVTQAMCRMFHMKCVSLEVQLYILTPAMRLKAVVKAAKRMPSHLTLEQNARMWNSRSDRL